MTTPSFQGSLLGSVGKQQFTDTADFTEIKNRLQYKMANHRRNGSAVWELAKQIGWNPSALILAGVGVEAIEAIHFQEDWPDALIYGFEPNPDTCIGLAGTFPGILYHFALSNEVGVSSLYYRSNWKNGSSLHWPTENSGMKDVIVPVTTLDVHFSKDDKIDSNDILLYLDVEGSELDVLRGGVELLKQVKMVNVEMTGRPRGETWCTPLEVHRFLKEAGFVQIYIHSIRTVRAQFDAVYVKPDIFDLDMCCCLDSVELFLNKEAK